MLLKFKAWVWQQRVTSIFGEIERLRDLAKDNPGNWEARQVIDVRIGRLLEELGDAKAELAILRARQESKRRRA